MWLFPLKKKKTNTLFFWAKKKERWTNALFLLSVISKYLSLKASDPSAVCLCVCVWSFPEQPAGHSFAISWFLADRQLCIQLPAPLAPQSDHELGKWRLPSMVRPGNYLCCEIELISNISIDVRVQQAGLKLSVRDIFPTARSTVPLLIFISLSSQGFSQAFVKFILKGLPQNPASSWENNTRCCYAVTTTHGAPWPDTMLRWAVTLKAAVSLMVPFNCQALQLSIFFLPA